MNKHIYVVEDNDDIRELVEFLLEAEDYQVSSFANITDFKTKWNTDLPDMMVLDVMLPDGNGLDVCNELKEDEFIKNIPILLMSANTNVSYITNQSKADDFIAKPFDIDELVKKVQYLLQ